MEEEKKENIEVEEVKEEEKTEEAKEEKSEFEKKFEKFNDTEDTTKDFDSKDIEENTAMGVLAYLSILVLIPLLAAPKSKFARYHTNQGLILFILELITGVLQGFLHFMFTAVVDVHAVDIIFSIIFYLIDLVYLLLIILGIVNVVQGKAKQLPIIGKFKIISVEPKADDADKENKEDK